MRKAVLSTEIPEKLLELVDHCRGRRLLSRSAFIRAAIIGEIEKTFPEEVHQALNLPNLSSLVRGDGSWTREHWVQVARKNMTKSDGKAPPVHGS